MRLTVRTVFDPLRPLKDFVFSEGRAWRRGRFSRSLRGRRELTWTGHWSCMGRNENASVASVAIWIAGAGGSRRSRTQDGGWLREIVRAGYRGGPVELAMAPPPSPHSLASRPGESFSSPNRERFVDAAGRTFSGGFPVSRRKVAVATRLELATSAVTGRRSNQLSYATSQRGGV